MHFYDKSVVAFVHTYQMQRYVSFATQIHKCILVTKDDNLHTSLLLYKTGNTIERNDMHKETPVRTLTFLKG